MAWHTRLRKYVVIKVVKKSSAGAIEVLRNEVEALKNIKNMHIPHVLDFLTENDYSFTIIEYIEGESFDKLLRLGERFTEDRIIKWYFQLASALDAIHRYEICHRDIKPANIMLDTNDDVCLIDFNSALVSGNSTGVISRSIGYASPEQHEYFKLCKSVSADVIRDYSHKTKAFLPVDDCTTEPASEAGSPECSGVGRKTQCLSDVYNIDWKLSDIYSLGATMHHLLTGKRPPVRTNDVVYIPRSGGYSESLLKIIERSIRTNPSERFASAKDLGIALRRVM